MAPLSGRHTPSYRYRIGGLHRLACLLLFAGMLFAPALESADGADLESEVKAAFLLNYTKFTEWPNAAFSSPTAPISICLWGDDRIELALTQMIEGEMVAGRRITAQKIRQPPPPKSCQVLFVSGSDKEASMILSNLGPWVLTVGEGESFLRAGGMVAFVIENRRVRFDINQRVAENAQLKLSSRLLSVARSVEK